MHKFYRQLMYTNVFRQKYTCVKLSQLIIQTYQSLPKLSSHPLCFYFYFPFVVRVFNIRPALLAKFKIQYYQSQALFCRVDLQNFFILSNRKFVFFDPPSSLPPHSPQQLQFCLLFLMSFTILGSKYKSNQAVFFFL